MQSGLQRDMRELLTCRDIVDSDTGESIASRCGAAPHIAGSFAGSSWAQHSPENRIFMALSCSAPSPPAVTFSTCCARAWAASVPAML